jgi:hypothetical protein
MHSITFSSEDQLLSVQSMINLQDPGTEIILDFPPCSINVRIPETFDSKIKMSLKRKAQFSILKKHSLCSDAIVIPVKQESYNKAHSFALQGSSLSLSRVETRNVFPIELAFAMTVHKAQGRTMPRVVLAVSEHCFAPCRMTYPSLFVAMTRVKCREHVRLLYHNSGTQPGTKGLRYIAALKPNLNVRHYYGGFVGSNGIWDPSRALRVRDASF